MLNDFLRVITTYLFKFLHFNEFTDKQKLYNLKNRTKLSSRMVFKQFCVKRKYDGFLHQRLFYCN